MNKKWRSLLLAILLVATLLTTAVVGASAATTLKITKQPASVSVAQGKDAVVKVTAQGDGLSYKWYYKEKNNTKFELTTSFTTNTYTTTLDCFGSPESQFTVKLR